MKIRTDGKTQKTSKQPTMKKFDVSPSKVLLILLGVLLAIIIGFSSNAIGGKTSLNNIEIPSPIKLEKVKDHFKAEMPKTMQQLVASVID